MSQQAGRRRTALALALPFLLSVLFPRCGFPSKRNRPGPLVYSAVVDASSTPSRPSTWSRRWTGPTARRAELVVFTLRTPGGLVDSTRAIVSHMIARAKTPVAVFVGPAGARAASAGFLLTIAADVAAMAPGTHIGAAHPVAGQRREDGRDDGEEGGRGRGRLRAHAGDAPTARNVPLADEAVRESRAFTEQEALTAYAAAHRPAWRRTCPTC